MDNQISRALMFCDSYGWPKDNRINLIDIMLERIKHLLNFLMEAHNAGDKKYVANVNAGHHLQYLADIRYIESNKLYIYARIF